MALYTEYVSCGNAGSQGVDEAAVHAMLAERLQAKLHKNYARADVIREELRGMGVSVDDGAKTWHVVAGGGRPGLDGGGYSSDE